MIVISLNGADMKRFLILSSVAFLTVVPVGAAPATKKFPTVSGRVLYRIISKGAMTMNNTTTLTWANYGQTFRKDLSVQITLSRAIIETMDDKSDTTTKQRSAKSWTLYDGQYIYSVLPQFRKIMRFNLGQSGLDQELGIVSNRKASTDKIIGHAMLLGKPTTIHAIAAENLKTILKSKVWMWGNLPLRVETQVTYKPRTTVTESKIGNVARHPQRLVVTSTMLATSLNPAIKPSPSLFRLPRGYVMQDMSALRKQKHSQQH